MPYTVSFSAQTHVGLVRDNNEDCFLAAPEQALWLIADGMGGHECGEVASALAKDTISELTVQGQSLAQAIKAADEKIKQVAKETQPQHLHHIMGTTIVALQIKGPVQEVSWVGDSRAYRLRDGNLEQITTDHSYVQTLFEAGQISREEMETHPQKNVITRALGGSDTEPVMVDSVFHLWHPNDKLLLCSDGLSDLVSRQEIHAVLQRSYDSDQQQVERLIDMALKRGGVDNITVVLVSLPRKDTARSYLSRIGRKFLQFMKT